MAVHFSSETDLWVTPQDFFDKLNDEFGFELDVCATHENAKCAKYFTEKENGLLQEWKGVVWMNPPYGREIGRWIQKAYESAQEGATVVCLIPARTDTAYWHDYCMKGEIRFVRGRLRFGGKVTTNERYLDWDDLDENKQPREKFKEVYREADNAPFPSAVVIFRNQPYDDRQLSIF